MSKMKQAVIVAVPGGERGTWWTINHPRRGVCLPGGKVDPGETPVMSARREMREETGLDVPAWALRVFSIGIIPGADDGATYQVTAFLGDPRRGTVSLGRGEAWIYPRPRTLAALRDAEWANRYDYHRAVYDRLEREDQNR